MIHHSFRMSSLTVLDLLVKHSLCIFFHNVLHTVITFSTDLTGTAFYASLYSQHLVYSKFLLVFVDQNEMSNLCKKSGKVFIFLSFDII